MINNLTFVRLLKCFIYISSLCATAKCDSEMSCQQDFMKILRQYLRENHVSIYIVIYCRLHYNKQEILGILLFRQLLQNI